MQISVAVLLDSFLTARTEKTREVQVWSFISIANSASHCQRLNRYDSVFAERFAVSSFILIPFVLFSSVEGNERIGSKKYN